MAPAHLAGHHVRHCILQVSSGTVHLLGSMAHIVRMLRLHLLLWPAAIQSVGPVDHEFHRLGHLSALVRRAQTWTIVLAALISRRSPGHLVRSSIWWTRLLHLQDVRECPVHAHRRRGVAGVLLSLLGFDFWGHPRKVPGLLGNGEEEAESES